MFSLENLCRNSSRLLRAVLKPVVLNAGARRMYPANPKRFYKNTNILYSDGFYEITLDHRKLRTPKGEVFKVDNEMLALGVAAEWDSQLSEIDRSSMHLTGLCNTVIDDVSKMKPSDIADRLLSYLETDTLLFQSHMDDVYELQQKEWQPVIDWFCEKYSVCLSPTREIIGAEISAKTKEAIKRHFLSYNLASLHGFLFAIEALKSVILGLCCVDRRLTVAQAVLLSRLEEEFQTGRWGRVEWAHDLSQYDLQARLASAVIFIHLNSMSEETKSKLVSVHR